MNTVALGDVDETLWAADQPHPDDIICLAKHHMWENRLMQAPFKLCPSRLADVLDRRGPSSAGLSGRAAKHILAWAGVHAQTLRCNVVEGSVRCGVLVDGCEVVGGKFTQAQCCFTLACSYCACAGWAGT